MVNLRAVSLRADKPEGREKLRAAKSFAIWYSIAGFSGRALAQAQAQALLSHTRQVSKLPGYQNIMFNIIISGVCGRWAYSNSYFMIIVTLFYSGKKCTWLKYLISYLPFFFSCLLYFSNIPGTLISSLQYYKFHYAASSVIWIFKWVVPHLRTVQIAYWIRVS